MVQGGAARLLARSETIEEDRLQWIPPNCYIWYNAPVTVLEADTDIVTYSLLTRFMSLGAYLLAFGCEQSDENQVPKSNPNVSSGPSDVLWLHAYDFCGGVWSHIPTSSSPGFSHCVAVAIVGSKLIVVGSTPLPKPKHNTKAALHCPPSRKSDLLIISILDLSQHSSQQPLAWVQRPASGQVPSFESLVGSPFTMCESEHLVFYSGSSGGRTDPAAGADHLKRPRSSTVGSRAEGIITLNLTTWSWTSIPMPPDTTGSNHQPVGPPKVKLEGGAQAAAGKGSSILSAETAGPCLCYFSPDSLFYVGGSPPGTEVSTNGVECDWHKCLPCCLKKTKPLIAFTKMFFRYSGFRWKPPLSRGREPQ